MMTTHKLKTWPTHFQAILDGVKTFEFRRNDRGFSLGDHLLLLEFDPDTQTYMGGEHEVVITYILEKGFGLPDGMVVMGIREVDPIIHELMSLIIQLRNTEELLNIYRRKQAVDGRCGRVWDPETHGELEDKLEKLEEQMTKYQPWGNP